MKKKLLSFILAVMMLAGCLSSLSVFAADKDEEAVDYLDLSQTEVLERDMRLRNTELLTEKEIQTKISDYYLKSKVDNEEDKLDEMTLVYSSYGYNLYHDRKSAEVAVENTKTGQILFTNPYDVNTGISSDAIKQELMSQIIIKYTDLSTGNTFEMLSYTDAAIKQQIQTKYIRGGIRV